MTTSTAGHRAGSGAGSGRARRWRRLRRAYTRSRVECSSTRVTYSRKTPRRATTTSWSTVTLLYRDATSTKIVIGRSDQFKPAGRSRGRPGWAGHGPRARKCQEPDTRAVAATTVPPGHAGHACREPPLPGVAPPGEGPMRLGFRLVLGLGMAALAAAVPSNRWLLGYAAVALLALTPKGPLLVQPVLQGQPAVPGPFLPGEIARPGVAEQEQGDPGDVGRHPGLAHGDARPQAGVLRPLLRGGGVLRGPDPRGGDGVGPGLGF